MLDPLCSVTTTIQDREESSCKNSLVNCPSHLAIQYFTTVAMAILRTFFAKSGLQTILLLWDIESFPSHTYSPWRSWLHPCLSWHESLPFFSGRHGCWGVDRAACVGASALFDVEKDSLEQFSPKLKKKNLIRVRFYSIMSIVQV